MRRFAVWFVAAAVPALTLWCLVYYDVTHHISDTQIAMGPPEDVIGFGRVQMLITVGIPTVLWAFLIWKAKNIAWSTAQKALCLVQVVIVVVAVGELAAHYRELEKRVLSQSNAGTQQAVPEAALRK